MLRGGPDGAHTMTLVLTPETLGPVEVQVTLSKGTVDLTLRGAHEHGRAALLDALPDLRRDLEAAGLTCSRAGGRPRHRRLVAGPALRPADAEQQASGERGGQQDRGDEVTTLAAVLPIPRERADPAAPADPRRPAWTCASEKE